MKPIKLTAEEIAARQIQVENGLANQYLAGLQPDHLTIDSSRRWAQGEISIQDAIADFKDRMKTHLKNKK